jgi:hypothetical protein
LCSIFWLIPQCLTFVCQCFRTLCQLPFHMWCKTELTECIKTSTHKIQISRNHPKRKYTTIIITVQGLINKRPDWCNKKFMFIDTTYSGLSPSEYFPLLATHHS